MFPKNSFAKRRREESGRYSVRTYGRRFERSNPTMLELTREKELVVLERHVIRILHNAAWTYEYIQKCMATGNMTRTSDYLSDLTETIIDLQKRIVRFGGEDADRLMRVLGPVSKRIKEALKIVNNSVLNKQTA